MHCMVYIIICTGIIGFNRFAVIGVCLFFIGLIPCSGSPYEKKIYDDNIFQNTVLFGISASYK